MKTPGVCVVSLALALALPAAGTPQRASSRLASYSHALVELRPGVDPHAVTSAGATLVSRDLRIWRLRTPATLRLLPSLERTGSVQTVEPDLPYIEFDHLTHGDPLIPAEWWISKVGLNRAEPPGPGVPVTVLDTGLDLTHPEFSSRPATVPLNAQRIDGSDDVHGTAVSSIAAAPANGIGLVGVYPRALLREWDFNDASLADVIGGLDAARRRGRGVVNMSGGFFGTSRLLARAVDRAFRAGVVLVAAAGNDRENGNRIVVPAALPHVLTVGATDQTDRVTFFSSRSNAMDLAAPGTSIPVAVPTFFNPTGYDVFDGTSFSAPMVAGAAAWVWTARPRLTPSQLEDVMRRSARDVGARGWDADTGWGVLDIPRALALATPRKDPQEPNDDVFEVRARGLARNGWPPLTTPRRFSASVRATLDVTEDPEDVYRVYVPAHGRVVVRTRGNTNVDVAVWGPRTASVFERGGAQRRDLRALSHRLGKRLDTAKARNRGSRGAYFYADVFLGRRIGNASYSLNAVTARR